MRWNFRVIAGAARRFSSTGESRYLSAIGRSLMTRRMGYMSAGMMIGGYSADRGHKLRGMTSGALVGFGLGMVRYNKIVNRILSRGKIV